MGSGRSRQFHFGAPEAFALPRRSLASRSIDEQFFERFRIPVGAVVKLADCDPKFSDEDESKSDSRSKLKELRDQLKDLQFRLYAEGKRSLLICLRAPDAGGKDGVVRHVIERAHDFLWRIERQAPKRGEVVVFNRSHYEDVLVARSRSRAQQRPSGGETKRGEPASQRREWRRGMSTPQELCTCTLVRTARLAGSGRLAWPKSGPGATRCRTSIRC
ncbi:MAG: hypothetical protein ABIQ16_00915 [Polyangiaceae bacterium]